MSIQEKVKLIQGGKFEGSSITNGKIYHDLPFEKLGKIRSHRGNTRGRINQILDIVDVKGKTVLDIGCNVGGISLGMAEAGASYVMGVDYDKESIDIAVEATKELEFTNANFDCENIDINSLKDIKNYDIIIWLSQWQWMVKQYGLDIAKDMLFEVSRKCEVLVFDSASDDGMARIKGSTQDDIENWLLENTCFDTIIRYKGLPGWLNRDLFICSNPVKRIKDRHIAASSIIERISRNEIKKTYKLSNIWMVKRESEFLTALKDSIHFPKLIETGDNYIVMSYCGRPGKVTKDMETQTSEILKALEIAGIKHRDIRSGNLLSLNGILYLIDFGLSIWITETDTPFLSAKRFRKESNTDSSAINEFFKSL